MSELEEILVAVDESQQSKKIVDFACKIAKTLPAKILLMYVSKSPETLEQYIGFVDVPLKDVRKEYSTVIAEKISSKLGEQIRASGIPYEFVLETGNPAAKIVDKARERKATAIFVGLS